MKNLALINGDTENVRHMFAISLILPCAMGSFGWALATGAAPTVPLLDNHLAVISLAIIPIALLFLPVPYLFSWDWRAKFLGAFLFPFASGSMLGIFPIMCIVVYSSLPSTVRVSLAVAHFIFIISWCKKFKTIYKSIYIDKELFNYLYREESDAVYFLRQADLKILEKKFKFDQFPRTTLFVFSLLAALLAVPFASTISQLVGAPFVHIFLAIVAAPLDLMFLGLCTKGWLVYFYYPMKITHSTGKQVYVDTSSRPIGAIPG